MMKRFAAILLACALLACIGAAGALADGTTVSVESARAQSGETVTLCVSVAGNPGFYNCSLTLNYDSSVLSLTGFDTKGTLLEGATVNPANGKVTFASSTPVMGDGVLLRASFQALDTAAIGASAVSVTVNSMRNEDEKQLNPITSNGTVTVFCEHAWDNGLVTTEPTCEGEGVRTYTCTKCGETKTETIPPIGHSWDEGTITIEPSCTAEGVKTYTCKHDASHTKTETVAKIDHQSDGGKVTKAPTCTEKGEKTYTCTVCGELLKTEEIEALGHSWDEGKVTKEPSCTEKGERLVTCKRCGETKTEGIEALGHSWDEGKITKEPTAETQGEKTYTCTLCKETKTEKLDKLPAAPKLTSGNKSTGYHDKELSFTSDAAFADFQKVLVDGKELPADDYTVKEGSTIVTLKAAYMTKLDYGKHSISIVSKNGEAKGEFTVARQSTGGVATGDEAQLTQYVVCMVLAAVGIAAAVGALKRTRRGRHEA